MVGATKFGMCAYVVVVVVAQGETREPLVGRWCERDSAATMSPSKRCRVHACMCVRGCGRVRERALPAWLYTRVLSHGSTARQLSSTALDRSSTARQPRQQLSSCQVDSFSTASRQLDSETGLRTCQGCQAVNSTARQPRQLDSSTAEAGASMHELVAPLDGMALFEVHPSRKMSLDKCSHQGSAHWHQFLARCTLQCIAPHHDV